MSENLNKIKEVLATNSIELDSYLEFCEENITNKILDVCNIAVIPDRLNMLIQEFLLEQYNLNKEGLGKGIKEVSGVSDNGQSISFKTVGGASSLATNINDFLNRNLSIINQYRKLRW